MPGEKPTIEAKRKRVAATIRTTTVQKEHLRDSSVYQSRNKVVL